MYKKTIFYNVISQKKPFTCVYYNKSPLLPFRNNMALSMVVRKFNIYGLHMYLPFGSVVFPCSL